MGRFIASGLATVISISENEHNKDEKNKEQLLKDIGTKVDLNLYDVKEYDDGYSLYLKTDIVNKHLNEFVKELTISNPLNTNVYEHIYGNKNKNVLDNDFKVKKRKDNTYELYLNNEKINEDDYLGPWEYFNYVYLPDSIYDNFAYLIEVKLLYLGIASNKFMPESDPYILYLMNPDLKTFENPLSTAFIYGIYG